MKQALSASVSSIIQLTTSHSILSLLHTLPSTPTPNHRSQIITMSDTYKPTENDGLKQDGTPDKRVGTGGLSSPHYLPVHYASH
jgi:hypothetical protein